MFNHIVISPTLQFLSDNFYYKDHKIKRILDLGAGQGQLCYWLRLLVKDPLIGDHKAEIDAIEIQPKFLPSLQRQYYSNIIIGDIYEHLDKLTGYDLVVGLEVIEHMEKEKSMEIIKHLRDHNKYLFMTTPNDFRDGGDHHGYHEDNPYQKHLCLFQKEDVKELGLDCSILNRQIYLYSKGLYFYNPTILRLLIRKIPVKVRNLALAIRT